jgi:hypothetical protein
MVGATKSSTTRDRAFHATAGMRRLKVVLREEAIADLADVRIHIARVSGSYIKATLSAA